MRYLCDNHIGPVNARAAGLGDFRIKGIGLANIHNEVLADYRRRLAIELAKYDRSQTALARHLGIDQSAVSRMISGTRRIRLEEQSAIEEYLRATDPTPQFEPIEKLPAATVGAYDPLAAFPDLESAISAAPEDMRALVELDNDYPLVMSCGAILEHELNRVVAAQISDGILPEHVFGYGLRDNLIEKVEALQGLNRLVPRQAAKLLAALAVRDAFAHSRIPLSLSHASVYPVAEQVLSPGYFEASQPQDPKALRLQFLLSTISLAHLMVVNDPEQTANLFLDAAAKVLAQADEPAKK